MKPISLSQNLMSSGSSAVFGIAFLVLLFVLSAVLVIGVKTIVYFAKMMFNKPPQEPQKKKRTRRHIKSIEINPDEVDRIYVKKAS